MSDEDTKYRHSKRLKRNVMARQLRDPGEHKGAFSLKVQDARKSEYKRIKLKPNDLIEEEDY